MPKRQRGISAPNRRSQVDPEFARRARSVKESSHG
jgi:hypothetical protein